MTHGSWFMGQGLIVSNWSCWVTKCYLCCVYSNDRNSLLFRLKINYVLAISLQGWDSNLDAEAMVWVTICDYNGGFDFSAPSYNLRVSSEVDRPLVEVVQGLFNDTDHYYGVSMNWGIVSVCRLRNLAASLNERYLYQNLCSKCHGDPANASMAIDIMLLLDHLSVYIFIWISAFSIRYFRDEYKMCEELVKVS